MTAIKWGTSSSSSFHNPSGVKKNKKNKKGKDGGAAELTVLTGFRPVYVPISTLRRSVRQTNTSRKACQFLEFIQRSFWPISPYSAKPCRRSTHSGDDPFRRDDVDILYDTDYPEIVYPVSCLLEPVKRRQIVRSLHQRRNGQQVLDEEDS